MNDGPFSLGNGQVERATPKALLVKLDKSSLLGQKSVWVPKSALHDNSELFNDIDNVSGGELVVQSWFARRQGWETE